MLPLRTSFVITHHPRSAGVPPAAAPCAKNAMNVPSSPHPRSRCGPEGRAPRQLLNVSQRISQRISNLLLSTRVLATTFVLLLSIPTLHSAAPAPAPSGAFYRVISSSPKYVTANLEFRDPTGAKWPNFFYGKPATDTGHLRLDGSKSIANFTLLLDKMAQDKGDQSRKVLGDLCAPEKYPAITLTVTGMSAPQDAATGGKDKGTQVAELTGTLELGGRKIPVKIPTKLRPHNGKGDEKNAALFLDGKATLPASALGLKTLAAETPIEIHFGLSAYPPQSDKAAPSTKPKK